MKNSAIAVNQESSLLLTLEEISQLVSHCHDPQETLTNIAQLIQGRFRTDVCSVYLIDPQGGDLVLAATVGLNPSSVGNVQMRFDEGLTGLVAERMAPVMESDAPAHPRFKYFQEAGEDPFHSFLGVPIIEAGAAEGVLVVQTTERRPFSPNEIRMLVTAASQLTPLVTGARLLEQVTGSGAARRAKSGAPAPTAASIVYGRGLSPGRGVGLAYVIDDQLETTVASSAASYDPAVEKGRLTSAVEAAREEIARLSRRISLLVGEDHGAILQAQLMILQDRSVERDLDSRLDAGDSAESAVSRTLDRYVARFAKMTNPFFQERIFDIKDVFRRIAWHLRPRDEAVVAGDRLILVSREASVLDLFSVDLDRLAGMVVEHGGPQSHAGIMARSLGVPMVGQVPCLLDHVQSGRRIAVDGGAGSLDLNPSPIATPTARAVSASVAFLSPSLRIAPAFSAEDDADVQAQAAPTGGPRVEANVNLLGEAGRVVLEGAAGVGLYRSEMIFLARRLNAQEALQYGLINKVVPKADLRKATEEWCEIMKGHSAQTLRATKKSFNFESDLLYASWQHGMEFLAEIWGSEEGLEGMNAFLEKRKPDFNKFRQRNKDRVDAYLKAIENDDNQAPVSKNAKR